MSKRRYQRRSKMKPRGVQHGSQNGSTNGSNMAPKWLQNGSLEASGRPLGADPASRAFPEPSRRGSGTARGSPKSRCWRPGGLLGRKVDRFHPPGGSLGGSRRGSGRSFSQFFCGWACRNGKSKETVHSLHLSGGVFFKCFLSFLFALPAAPAEARTLKKQVFVWKVFKISLVGHFLAQRKKSRSQDNSLKTWPQN